MQPLHNEVLFKPHPSQEQTESGLFVPDAFKAVSNKGTIIETGRGTVKKPMRLKKGIVVFRVKDWGTPYIINNELYFLMDEGAIIAIEA